MLKQISFLSLLLILLTFSGVGEANPDTSILSEKKASIRTVINKMYDTPEHKVLIDPVVVNKKYALASWIHADIGGRVVMHQNDKKQWEVVLCSGKAVTDKDFLLTTGMPASTAETLVQELALTEAKLSKEKIALFDSFKAVVRGSHQAMHESGDSKSHPTKSHPVNKGNHTDSPESSSVESSSVKSSSVKSSSVKSSSAKRSEKKSHH